ncbi:MAG: tRNA (adenosine(37)-N6)-dimethylallyltransferase MiaA, partial [Clostridia bacterium]|nr:tRNA (adenosine(37)-N6)-dimethylallyltransferase MiaA [Clostridia bacterium]
AVDPESAESAHPNNLRRVIRALEIYRLTGVPKSEWDRRSKTAPSRYNAAVLGLVFADRALLYDRIERRVDLMLADGLLAETRALCDAGVFERSATAAAAIGYKELLPYLAGTCTLEEAVTELKTATRRYAKRQLTWFCAKDYVHPLTVDGENGILKSEQIVNNALALAERAWSML